MQFCQFLVVQRPHKNIVDVKTTLITPYTNLTCLITAISISPLMHQFSVNVELEGIMPYNHLKGISFPNFKLEACLPGDLMPAPITITHDPIIMSYAKIITMEIICTGTFVCATEDDSCVLIVFLG